jgi:hypothetical protein
MVALRVSGLGEREVLSEGDCTPQSWSPDRRSVACEWATAESADLRVVALDGGKPIEIAATPAWENMGQFSPDGRFIAYHAGGQIYVQPFPPTGDRWQVSRSGGDFPRWRADGREVYFLTFDDTLMAADVDAAGGPLRIGIPHPLFRAAFKHFQNRYPYAVARDGQRFLVNVEKRPTPPVFDVVVDWSDALPR